MMKKITTILAAVAIMAAAVIANPAETKAAYSCSIDTINAANAQIAAATLNYQAAQATEAAALAKLNTLRATGASELEIATASLAYEQAKNATHWQLDQVNNAKAYLTNITNRANQETALQESYAQLANLTKMQNAKLEADSAQAVAVGVAQQIANIQNTINALKTIVATNPAVYQAQIDALNVQLKALQNELAAKQAIANQKLAVYNQAVAADHYDQYTSFWIDYWNHRDAVREHPNLNCSCDICKAYRVQNGLEESTSSACK